MTQLSFGFYDFDCVTEATERNIDEFGKFCADNGILINNAVVNSPDAGIGGSLVSPDDRPKYLARLKDTIKICKDINCHAAITCTGNALSGVPREQQKQCVIDTLKAAAEIAEAEDFTLFVEALKHACSTMKGYFPLGSAEECRRKL